MSSRFAVLAACAAVFCAVAGAAAAGPAPQISISTTPETKGPYVGWTTGADGAPRYAPAGVTLPAAVAGQAEPELRDLEKGSDGAARYGAPGDDQIWTSVYVFKPGVADVALLTLQADAAVRRAGVPAGEAQAASLDGAAVGRRVLYPAYDGIVHGLTIARAGPWVVKVRTSGPAGRPEAVAAAMDEALSGVRWDQNAFAPAPAVTTLAPCPADGKRKPAKPAAMDTTDVLGALVVTAAAAQKSAETPLDLAHACLVAGAYTPERPIQIVHFADPDSGRRERTLVLLGDAGAALDISSSPSLQGGKPKYVMGKREGGDSYSVVGAFKDWPSDQQILDLFKR
ncbi:hypothetical protein [Caulobacter sp. 17J65-9]|uniref:hypothetical protein n=1 Tax=Caulobacter sp. 17J65-9 TaxID=2709382 RepID=UPI0013C91509|nr:hypothetical protein [Caulobacter sp. 17J65-9]NEX92622.1 hypothetical protein [Caulobacter sp. 17J65-9]